MKFNREDFQESIIDLRTENGLTGGIPASEPVFLLRANDACAPQVVRVWAFEARRCGASKDMVASALEVAIAMQDWQKIHGYKPPTLPGEKP